MTAPERADGDTAYTLDNAWRQARERLSLLENILDPLTIDHLQATGVGAGWRCLEVGGGLGSIAAWLCDRVGASGGVVATDIDTRFLQSLNRPNAEIHTHNIVTDELAQASFDLIHLRAVLEHLPQREAAFRQMIGALKPGGVARC